MLFILITNVRSSRKKMLNDRVAVYLLRFELSRASSSIVRVRQTTVIDARDEERIACVDSVLALIFPLTRKALREGYLFDEWTGLSWRWHR